MISRSFTVLLLLALFVHTTFAQYSRGTRVEVNHGVRTAWWSEKDGQASTSVSTLNPAPTVWYNCHYARAICNNVEKTQPGANAGTLQMELVYDSDHKRATARRGGKKGVPGICPGNWKDTHICPEPDQPPIWVTDMSRDPVNPQNIEIPNLLKYPSGKQQVLDKDTQKTVEKTNYQIADYEDMPSGLMYTCDEFPFATTIQGGIGLTGDANAGLNFAGTTYCAPQNSACGKNTEWFKRWASDNPETALLYQKAKLKGAAALSKFRKETRFAFPKSDQDFQAKALSEISSIFSKQKKGLYSYQLRTKNAESDDRVTWVEYTAPTPNQKRESSRENAQYVYEVFLNGTNSRRRLSAAPNQSRNHYSRRDGFNTTQTVQNVTSVQASGSSTSLWTNPVGSNTTMQLFGMSSGFITSILTSSPVNLSFSSSTSAKELNTTTSLSTTNSTADNTKPVPITTVASRSSSSLLSTESDQNNTSTDLTSTLTTEPMIISVLTSDEGTTTTSSDVETESGSSQASSTTSTSSTVNGSYITLSDVWEVSSPVITCTSIPCLVVLPPYTLPTPTTIIRDPVTEDDKTVTFPPFTTDRVEWSRITIDDLSETVDPTMSIEDPFDTGKINPPITIDLPSLPHIHVVGAKPTATPSATPKLSSTPTSTKPPDKTEEATSTIDATTESIQTSAIPTETASITPVPPPADEDQGDEDGRDEDEEEEDEEEEEEEGEDCVVPGWDVSDFPIGGDTSDNDLGQDSAATSLESSVASTTSTDAAATTTKMSSTMSTEASMTTSIGTATCNSAPVATETDGTYEVSIEFAVEAVNDFCKSMQSQGKVFSPGQNTSSGDLYFPNGQSGAIRSGNPIQLSAQWNDDDDNGCPTLDFSKSDAMDTCRTILGSVYSSCSNTFINVPVTWGGTLYQDCIQWELQPVEDHTSLDG
ncbi:hypothetical protein KCU81_g6045, partial [Aureobasidium melanogenum]|uniref:Uncharacterized protein n=1 Tax=Aureobasidium melanogenum (strain CBS 110374) TaxID=1043003 RepID=A0A074WUC9_AURM1